MAHVVFDLDLSIFHKISYIAMISRPTQKVRAKYHNFSILKPVKYPMKISKPQTQWTSHL